MRFGFHYDEDPMVGLFGDHLRRILLGLSHDAELAAAARAVLAGQPCPTSETFYRLRSAGVLSGGSAAEVRFRCWLYATYLTRHLGHLHGHFHGHLHTPPGD